jgi:hypothetical protein
MLPRRSLPFLIPFFVGLVGCQGKDASPNAATKSSATSASAGSAAERVQLRPIVATSVKVVRCNLPPVRAENLPEKWNNIAATRNLHLAGDGSLYFFPDYTQPVKLEATTEGCGYRLVGPLPEKKDSEHGVDTRGNIVDVPFSDESKRAKCRVRALQKLRYGDGRLYGTRFLYNDSGSVMELDLANDECEAKELKLDALPKDGGKPDISVAGNDLVLAVGRADWKYDKEIFRLDPKGKLLGRVGTATGDTKIDGQVYACGDGYCVTSGSSWLAIHDRTGRKLATLKLHELTDLEDATIEGIVDVPGKPIFVLVGYHPKNELGRAELVRLDGVF